MVTSKQDEALRSAAATARANPLWVGYADYCELRERGLRKDALAALGRFVAGARRWAFADRRVFVDWLCRRKAVGAGDPHGLSPSPLTREVVNPTLAEWMVADPVDPAPHRWAGLLQHFPADDHLRKALELDARDQLSRRGLVRVILGLFGHATHHLPDFYIGDPAADLMATGEAQQVCDGLTDVAERRDAADGIDYFRRLIGDWITFSASGEGDFAGWCDRSGRRYHWVRAYYYR